MIGFVLTALAGNVQLETFDHVTERIPAVHPDPLPTWKSTAQALRKQAKKARTAEALRPTLNTLLGSLGESHFAVAGPVSDTHDVGPGLMAGGTTGASIATDEMGVFVYRVEPDSPAHRVGIQPGDRVHRIDTHSVDDVHEAVHSHTPAPMATFILRNRVHSWLDGPPGTSVEVELQDQRTVRLARTHRGVFIASPAQKMPAQAAVWSDRAVVLEEERTARVIRLEIFNAPAMRRFIQAMETARQEDSAIVLDLRGNPGGVIQVGRGVAGFFVDTKGSLGSMRTKAADLELVVHPRPTSQRFHGPLAILVDQASGSTSEILAAAFQETKRARIFGSQTPGMALPSHFETLPNGDTLQLAIGDLRTPKGTRIEGVGVRPDVVVTPPAPGDRDMVLQSALSWLAEETR